MKTTIKAIIQWHKDYAAPKELHTPRTIAWHLAAVKELRATMKIVRLDAASQCRALGGDCGKCGPCLARKLMKGKATR